MATANNQAKFLLMNCNGDQMMTEISTSSRSFYQQSQGSRRRRRREMSVGICSLFTVTILILSTLLPPALASPTSLLRGKKKPDKIFYNDIPQHGAQRPSIPFQHDENMRQLVLIASSSRNHEEREEARRKLSSVMDDKEGSDQHLRELARNNSKKKLTKQQRQRIKKLNAQRKKKNAERRKKMEQRDKKKQIKQMQKLINQQSSQKQKKDADVKTEEQEEKDSSRTDGKFTFGPPPPEKPKPMNSAGSFSAYQTGNSMADAFVDSMAASFVSSESSGGSGPAPTPISITLPKPKPPAPEEEEGDDEGEMQEASDNYSITQGSLVSSLRDTSTQIDGFEKSPSELNWEFSEKYAWKYTEDVSYEGKSSIMSGLPPSSTNVVVGKSLYSNITLSLDNEDLDQAVGKNNDGAVLSFQVKATEALSWPISAFMVSVNDKVVLSPSDIESSASKMWENNEWMEFSVPIDAVDSKSSKYNVKFTHVANPLKLEKLPKVPDALKLYIDDVRLAPFTRKSDPLDMTTSGSEGAKWKDESGVFVAKSDSMTQKSGYADLTSILYSKRGGRLKYELKTSTQGPFDDLAILINGKLQDAQFGQSANFEYVQMEIPRGKAVITIRHRKNPGQLPAATLDKLGNIRTDGTNRVKNIELWPVE